MVCFIRELFQTFDYQSEKRNIRFTFEHEQAELPVWIDRNNFDKVLLNVLSNAFKYTPDGGEITVRLTSGTDKKASGALRNYAEVAVSDTGDGIDENKLEKIFVVGSVRFWNRIEPMPFAGQPASWHNCSFQPQGL